jgi:hypothetical protein
MIELLIFIGIGSALLLAHIASAVAYKFATRSPKSIREILKEL